MAMWNHEQGLRLPLDRSQWGHVAIERRWTNHNQIFNQQLYFFCSKQTYQSLIRRFLSLIFKKFRISYLPMWCLNCKMCPRNIKTKKVTSPWVAWKIHQKRFLHQKSVSWMAINQCEGSTVEILGFIFSRCDQKMDPTMVSFVKHERLLILHKKKSVLDLDLLVKNAWKKFK